MISHTTQGIALFEGCQASPACPSDKSKIKIRSNGRMLADKEEPKYSDKSMSQCYFVNYHVIGTGLGSKAKLLAKSPDTKQSDPRHGLSANDI